MNPTMENPKRLIWSFEHNEWWRPNELGYTTWYEEAGTYGRERAAEIVQRANIACEPNQLDEAIVEIYETVSTDYTYWHAVMFYGDERRFAGHKTTEAHAVVELFDVLRTEGLKP